MPSTIPCPAEPRPQPARQPVHSPVDALHTALAALGPGRPGTACLLLGPDRRGLGCLVVDGAVHARQVGTLASVLLDALEPGTALVLVTARPAGGPVAVDRTRFRSLRDGFASEGVALVDWLVVTGGSATSLAAATGVPDLW